MYKYFNFSENAKFIPEWFIEYNVQLRNSNKTFATKNL